MGPLSPVTDRGNRYILTLVDFSTRYPEAIALRSIDTAVYIYIIYSQDTVIDNIIAILYECEMCAV